MVLGHSLPPPGRWGAKHMFSSRKLIWVKSLGRLARLDGANVYNGLALANLFQPDFRSAIHQAS